MKNRWLARLLGVLPLLSVFVASLALAQEYVPVKDGAQPRTDPNPYILGAYGFIWVAVLVYVVMLARGLSRARADVEELRRRVDGGARRP